MTWLLDYFDVIKCSARSSSLVDTLCYSTPAVVYTHTHLIIFSRLSTFSLNRIDINKSFDFSWDAMQCCFVLCTRRCTGNIIKTPVLSTIWNWLAPKPSVACHRGIYKGRSLLLRPIGGPSSSSLYVAKCILLSKQSWRDTQKRIEDGTAEPEVEISQHKSYQLLLRCV